jgi:hypothetical protein
MPDRPEHVLRRESLAIAALYVSLFTWCTSALHAQEPEAATGEPAPTAEVTPPPAEERVFAPPPPEVPPPRPEEPPVAEPAPAGEKITPSLKIGVGIRSGLSLGINTPSDNVELSLSDSLDQLIVRPYFSGQLTKRVSLTANLEATSSSVHILDAILQVALMDELQIWIGQHIPANDRSAFCGPFYHNSWNFPITVQSFPFDTAARDRGFTIWGLIGGGLVKYHLSLVDLQTNRSIAQSRLAGKVTLNLLDPENYYYASGTYFGAQDTLAIGAVVQYQAGSDGVDGDGDGGIDGDANGDGELDNDFVGFAFDLLYEQKFGGAGTFTLEGGYWNFEGSGDEYVVNQGSANVGFGFTGPEPGSSYLLALSWLSPDKLGPGQLQPNARLQAGIGDGYTAAGEPMTFDVGLAYIVDGFNHRWHLNYRHVAVDGDLDSDSIQLGAQLQL